MNLTWAVIELVVGTTAAMAGGLRGLVRVETQVVRAQVVGKEAEKGVVGREVEKVVVVREGLVEVVVGVEMVVEVLVVVMEVVVVGEV